MCASSSGAVCEHDTQLLQAGQALKSSMENAFKELDRLLYIEVQETVDLCMQQDECISKKFTFVLAMKTSY
jgi:hypothetical protein